MGDHLFLNYHLFWGQQTFFHQGGVEKNPGLTLKKPPMTGNSVYILFTLRSLRIFKFLMLLARSSRLVCGVTESRQIIWLEIIPALSARWFVDVFQRLSLGWFSQNQFDSLGESIPDGVLHGEFTGKSSSLIHALASLTVITVTESWLPDEVDMWKIHAFPMKLIYKKMWIFMDFPQMERAFFWPHGKQVIFWMMIIPNTMDMMCRYVYYDYYHYYYYYYYHYYYVYIYIYVYDVYDVYDVYYGYYGYDVYMWNFPFCHGGSASHHWCQYKTSDSDLDDFGYPYFQESLITCINKIQQTSKFIPVTPVWSLTSPWLSCSINEHLYHYISINILSN